MSSSHLISPHPVSHKTCTFAQFQFLWFLKSVEFHVMSCSWVQWLHRSLSLFHWIESTWLVWCGCLCDCAMGKSSKVHSHCTSAVCDNGAHYHGVNVFFGMYSIVRAFQAIWRTPPKQCSRSLSSFVQFSSAQYHAYVCTCVLWQHVYINRNTNSMFSTFGKANVRFWIEWVIKMCHSLWLYYIQLNRSFLGFRHTQNREHGEHKCTCKRNRNISFSSFSSILLCLCLLPVRVMSLCSFMLRVNRSLPVQIKEEEKMHYVTSYENFPFWHFYICTCLRCLFLLHLVSTTIHTSNGHIKWIYILRL